MNWIEYIESRYKSDFFEHHGLRLDDISKKYFSGFDVTEFYVKAFYYNNMYYYYGYQNNEQMTERYDRFPVEENINLDLWNNVKTQMSKDSPFHLHIYQDLLLDLKFIDRVTEKIMEAKDVDWDTATQYIVNSHLYDVMRDCDRNFIHHYDSDYWAEQVLQFYKK